MRSLANKNFRLFLRSTGVIFLFSAPVLFFSMVFFYAKDLDELIWFRRDEFISKNLPEFEQTDIEIWNHYTEDVQILEYKDSYILDKPLQEPYFNKAEGHPVDYRVLYSKIEIENQPYILMSRIPMIENHDLMLTFVVQYLILFVLLFLMLLIILRKITKKVWQPFYDTLGKIQNFHLEMESPPRFGETNIIEFANLNNLLTHLMENNLRVYKEQKEFIENASHELQTPLAVFQSQLDILIQSPDINQQQVEVIQSLYSVSSRMTRLNKNLLLLARISNKQYAQMEEIDFVQILYQQLLYLREQAESEGIRVEVYVENPLVVKANKTLLESLITNLVVNAINHNTNGGEIKMSIQDNSFIIMNTGQSQPLDPDKIFRRFNKTTHEKKGNGLGLSIVLQICKLHNWELEYRYENGYHTFIVSFRII